MKRLASRFDPSTGRHSAMSEIPPNALRVECTDTEIVIYEPGDEHLLPVTEQAKPAPAQVESGWWRKTLSAIGIK
jgi:hypothetical protein